MKQHVPLVESPAGGTSCLGAIARLSWMLLGNVVLLFLAVLIFQSGAFSALDLAYWFVAAGMSVIRLIDIARFQGLTKDGEPATLDHWRRYTLFLVLISGGLWALAHIL